MAKRLRRFTMTVGGAPVVGARDFTYDDGSEFNNDRGDDEQAGVEVRMTRGPYNVKFELLQHNAAVASGYCAALSVVVKEIDVANGVETSVDKTYTFNDGHLIVGGSNPTENAGRIPVSGRFRTLTPPA